MKKFILTTALILTLSSLSCEAKAQSEGLLRGILNEASSLDGCVPSEIIIFNGFIGSSVKNVLVAGTRAMRTMIVETATGLRKLFVRFE